MLLNFKTTVTFYIKEVIDIATSDPDKFAITAINSAGSIIVSSLLLLQFPTLFFCRLISSLILFST